jgi:hypothetical protein
MNSLILGLAASLVAGAIAGLLTFTVATGTVGVMNLQSQPAMACNSAGC